MPTFSGDLFLSGYLECESFLLTVYTVCMYTVCIVYVHISITGAVDIVNHRSLNILQFYVRLFILIN